ncbi:MAG: hypothetical protein QM744_14455 [Mesorhizobium sp.]
MLAALGDNSKMLTPVEDRALFFHHFNKIAAQRAIVDAAKAEEKRLRKIAKADQIALRDIDFAMRCAEIDDAMIVADDLRRHFLIAHWFALPVGEAPEFDFDAEPINDRAAREGLAAGLAAKDRDANPYDPNTPVGRIWTENYDQGQQEARDNLEAAMTKRNAEREAANGADADYDDEDDGG